MSTRWRLCVFYIFNSTVIDWTCYMFFYLCWCVIRNGRVDWRLRHTERGLPPRLAARNLSYSISQHQWQTESGFTRRPAVGRSSHYSFVFEDSLSTRPVQDGHRKTDWPTEKQWFSLWCGPQWLQKRGEEGRSMSMVFTHIFTRFVNFMNPLPFLDFLLTASSSSSPSSTEDSEDSSYTMESKYHVGTRSTLRCKLKRKQRPPAVGRYLYALTKPLGDTA